MTRGDAIAKIKILKEDYWEDDGYGHETDDCQNTILALDMAITELEKEPCDDCISRRAVLERAINAPIAKVVTEDKVIYRKIIFADDVEQLPPVTPAKKVGQWLCSDDIFEHAVCSLCKENSYEPFVYAKKHFKYCPICGSKMQEVGYLIKTGQTLEEVEE